MRRQAAHQNRPERSDSMSKLTILTVLAIVYLGVVRVAHFVLSLLIILFFGVAIYRLIHNLRLSAHRQAA
jgi:Flp pilus assembly protein TadB